MAHGILGSCNRIKIYIDMTREFTLVKSQKNNIWICWKTINPLVYCKIYGWILQLLEIQRKMIQS